MRELIQEVRTGKNVGGQATMDFFEESFNTPSARLGFLMGDRGVKQKEVAEILGVSAPYISNVVAGEKDLRPENWLRLAEHFGVTLDWLMCRSGAPMAWSAGVDDGLSGNSKQADEAAAILDSMPPRKRDEMLGVLRAMSFSVRVSQLDADETVKRLRDSLAAAGVILSPKVVEAVRSVLFAYAMGLGVGDRD